MITALVVNFTWKMNVIAVILNAVSLHWNCAKIFKYSDKQYTGLTPDKLLNRWIYRMLLYVNVYGSYKLSKNSLVFWPTLYCVYKQDCTMNWQNHWTTKAKRLLQISLLIYSKNTAIICKQRIVNCWLKRTNWNTIGLKYHKSVVLHNYSKFWECKLAQHSLHTSISPSAKTKRTLPL